MKDFNVGGVLAALLRTVGRGADAVLHDDAPRERTSLPEADAFVWLLRIGTALSHD